MSDNDLKNVIWVNARARHAWTKPRHRKHIAPVERGKRARCIGQHCAEHSSGGGAA